MKQLVAFVALSPFLAAPASAGIIETFQDTITAPTHNYLTLSLNIGAELWGSLFIAQACVNIAKGCRQDQTISGWAWYLGETFWAMVPSLVLLNGARAVLPGLSKLIGYLAGGTTGHPMLAGGVDAIGQLGVQTAVQLIIASTLNLLNPAGLLLAQWFMGVGLFSASVCLVCFFLLALEIVLAFFDALFITSIGAAQIGFAAADATRPMAMEYVAGVSAAVWKCVILFAYGALVSDIYTALGAEFAHGLGNPLTFFITALEMVGFSVIAFVAAFKIGGRAERVFSGAAVVTAANIADHARQTASYGVQAARMIVKR